MKKKKRKIYKNRYVEDDIMAQKDLEDLEKNKVIIQDEIKVDKEYVNEVIKRYDKMKTNFRLCFGDFDGNKDDIIREIKKNSKIGKDILMMQYRFETSDFYKKNKDKLKKLEAGG